MKTTRLRKLLPAIAILLALLSIPVAGCGDNTEVSPATAASAAGPSVQPPAGWNKFSGGGADVYLPSGFDGGDPSADLQNVAGRLRALGPDYEELAKALEADPSAFAIWVFDSTSAPSGFLTNLNVVLDRVPTSVTLEEYVDATIKQLPGDFHVASRAELRLNGREAVRLVMEFTVQGVKGSQLIYVVKGPSGLWTLTYSTSAAEFQTRLPDLEKSAATFRAGS